MKKIALQVLYVLLIPILISCNPLHVISFTPSGETGSIVVIEGDVSFAQVIWDAGTPAAHSIPSGFLGANFFTVPRDAALGIHQFQIVRNDQRSELLTFNVTANRVSVAAQINEISPVWTSFRPDGRVTSWLMVQGSNIDAGATVMVGGVAAPTLSYKVLLNDLYGVDPNTLSVPKYHYGALLVMITGQPGSPLNFSVKNLSGGGNASAPFEYRLPESASSLDSDNDNIPDVWEINGYDYNNDGVIDLDLRALGADPYRKDIFLELDVMEALVHPPEEDVFNVTRRAFAAAPLISGRSAKNGISLYVDRSGSVPYSEYITRECCADPAMNVVDLYDYKRSYFDNNSRGRIFQYGVWAHAIINGPSGTSDSDAQGNDRRFIVPGDELIVAFDNFSDPFQTTIFKAGTLFHELGHNLLQTHGGNNHFPYNPAYNSMMSYNWSLRSGNTNEFRKRRHCCAPFYYALAGAREIDGGLVSAPGMVIDLSEGMGNVYSELSLDETIGICDNIPVDWDLSGTIGPEQVHVNVDRSVYVTFDPLRIQEEDLFGDFCNWCTLNFKGPELNGIRD